jgi:signal transduction histidine kinase
MIARPPNSTSPQLSLDELFKHLDSAQTELDSLRDHVAHLNRLATVGLLAAGMAHEISNLLTPVLCYAQLAAKHPEDASAQRKAAKMAHAGVTAAVRLAQANLAFASPANPKERAPACYVRAAVEAAFACIGGADRDVSHLGNGVTTPRDRVALPHGVSCTIKIDNSLRAAIAPLPLQQVVLNLLLNALAVLRHVEQRRIEITAVEEPKGSVVLGIADTGPGIPAELRDRLFEPFATGLCGDGPCKTDGSPASPDACGGSGLGLTICRMIVERADGEITVRSTPGRTLFTIRLPAIT